MVFNLRNHPCKRYIRFGIQFYIVDITVSPFLARFKGFDDRVLGCMKVLGGVTIGRTIAATNMAAFKTQSKVNPKTANL